MIHTVARGMLGRNWFLSLGCTSSARNWAGRRNCKPRRRRSSAGWMPARTARLFAGVGRIYPVTISKESLMAASMRWIIALQHQTEEQYSVVELTRTRVPTLSVVAAAPYSKPASRLRWATRDVSLLQSFSKFGDTWATCPTLLWSIWTRSRRAGFVVPCCWGGRLLTPFCSAEF